jgi:hypothetical protein
MIEFDSLNPSKIKLQFSGIGNDHYGIYVRTIAFSDCAINNTFNLIIGSTNLSVAITPNG